MDVAKAGTGGQGPSSRLMSRAMTSPFPQMEHWLKADAERLLLRVAADLHLPGAWLVAGFVRSLAWDRRHGHAESTPLADLDVIYSMRPAAAASETGKSKRRRDCPGRYAISRSCIFATMTLPMPTAWMPCASGSKWRPHWRASDRGGRYRGGQSLRSGGALRPAPHPQSLRPRPEAFRQRLATKGWCERWPRLQVQEPGSRRGAWPIRP